jgi:hypothetical protein
MTKSTFANLKKLNDFRARFYHEPYSQYEFSSENELVAELKNATRVANDGKDPWNYGNRG